MGFSDRATSAQLNLTGAVSALTYGYLSHMNNVGIDPITIPNDDIQIDKNNIGNPDIGTETLRGIIHGYQVAFNSQLIVDDTVCDPKYIPCNCIMKDKNGYIQYGAGDELYLDYPINEANTLKFPNWTESTISNTSRYWFSVCYGNDKFVAVARSTNYFAYSTDGINWTESTISDTSRNWQSVCYGNGKFVTVADETNYFAYSTDGINWTEGTISSTSRSWQSICYGNDKFVAVTFNDKYSAYSTDGINWTEVMISEIGRTWYSVCYGNDKFVAVVWSSDDFAYSTDGINWTEGNISSTSRKWYSVCYGNGKFITVASSTNYFAYSTDGINWTEGTISSTSRDWISICYGNGKFVTVALSNNYFAYSTDGITWTEGMISSTSRRWISICYGNNKFIAVAQNTNYFAYSPIYTIHEYNLSNIPLAFINKSDSIGIGNNKALDSYLEIIDSDYNTYGILNYKEINGNPLLINSLQGGDLFLYITNDQFYRYIKFQDSSIDYLAITSDLMHFTTYKIPSQTDYYVIKAGILFMYIPEKDSVAMITRHPNITDIIEIDGNDPENMIDYNKPYYRLIEIPFLKKYYKYSGKHVTNVRIKAIANLSYDDNILGSNHYLSDYTLIINVFDKTYRIGIPNYNINDIKSENCKRLQEFYTSNEQTFTNMENMKSISQLMCKYSSSITNITCGIYHRHTKYIITSDLNITTDQMNTGYDFDVDESVTPRNKNISNYTFVGANSISDLSTPNSSIYPYTIESPVFIPPV